MWCVYCAVRLESLNKIKFHVIPWRVTHILQTTICLPHDRQRATVMCVALWSISRIAYCALWKWKVWYVRCKWNGVCCLAGHSGLNVRALGSCDRASWAKCEDSEKTNKMQQSDVYYQLLSQHVSGIIMPIFGRTKTVCHCIRCTALVLLDVVGSGCGALRMRTLCLLTQRPTTATNHIQQNQRGTPYWHTVFVLLKMGMMMPETCWDRSW